MNSSQAPDSNIVPLETHDLCVSYHKRPVLYGVDVAIPAGQLVGILGPNGAGKTTFIKTIMGVLQPTSGWVKIYGQPLQNSIQRVGYVPQRSSVDWDFPVSVHDVVMMGRYGRMGFFRRPSDDDCRIVNECLDRVHMRHYADRQIANLSGGQQQRVFLARALAQESDLYLMDEPFAGVDAATEAAIIELLRELKQRGKTVIVVHHDLPTAKEYFDYLMLLNMRLIAFGKTQDVFNYQLLQKTYGGRLTILSEVAEAIGAESKELSSDSE